MITQGRVKFALPSIHHEAMPHVNTRHYTDRQTTPKAPHGLAYIITVSASSPDQRAKTASVPKSRPNSPTVSLATDQGMQRRPKRSVVTCDNPNPLMLLPRIETRMSTDFFEFASNLKRSAVIPVDMRASLNLSSGRGSLVGEGPISIDAKGIIASMSHHLKDTAKETDSDYSNMPDHIDSYAGPDSIEHYLRRRSRVRSADSGYSDGDRYCLEAMERLGISVNENCPECMRLIKKFGGVKNFMKWFLKRVEGRQEFEQLPKYSNIIRGNTPHFCNFVRKLKLHERDDLPPRRIREAFGSIDDLDDLDTVSLKSGGSRSSRGTRHSGKSGGTHGPPGSPSDGEDVEDEYSSKIDVTIKTPGGAGGTISTGPDVKGRKPGKKGAKSNQASGSKSSLSEPISVPGGSKEERTGPPNEPLAGWQEGRKNKTKGASAYVDEGGDRPGKDDVNEGVKVKRAVIKKEKKPFERAPRVGPDGDGRTEVQEENGETVKPEEPSEPAEPVAAPPKLIEVPPPKLKEPQPEKKISRQFEKQSLLFNADPFKLDPADQLEYELRMRRKDFELMAADTININAIKMSGGNHYAQGRLALSKQSSRFELPMDMRVLETMTPQEYLRHYCIISSRRQTLYQKIFMKHKDGKSGKLTEKDLDKAIKEVLINTISQEQVNDIFQMVGINEEIRVDQKLFSGIAAFSERMLYSKFVTEDTIDFPDHQKEKIESADFSALSWKLRGLKLPPEIDRIIRLL